MYMLYVCVCRCDLGPVDPTYTHETLSSQQHSKQSLLMTKETEITDSSGDIELSSFDSSGEPAGQERLSKSIINVHMPNYIWLSNCFWDK